MSAVSLVQVFTQTHCIFGQYSKQVVTAYDTGTRDCTIGALFFGESKWSASRRSKPAASNSKLLAGGNTCLRHRGEKEKIGAHCRYLAWKDQGNDP